MPSHPRILLAAALCTALAAVTGCATIPKDQQAVKTIHIEGTKQVDEDAIKEKILTTEPSWPWSVELFDPTAWQADLRRIERFYETQGFYQARVVDDEIVPTDPKHLAITVKVEEGQPTLIGEIRVEGLAALTEEQRRVLLDAFTLREGDVFKEDDWTPVKPMLRSRLREMGYAEAIVNGSVEVDVDTHTARVLLNIEPGQRYKFGDIFVATDARPHVPPKWIVDTARLSIEPGQYYSESALSDAQSRVFKMGVFGGVRVTRGAPDRANATVPVIVDVREAPFRTVRFGGGVGIDQSRNEARLLGEYTNRNFFGGLRLFSAQGRVGWAFLPNVVDVLVNRSGVSTHSEPLFNTVLEFQQPRVLTPSLNYFVSLEAERRPEQAFAVFTLQGKTGLSWSPHPSFTAHLSYNVERNLFLRGAGGTLAGDVPPLAYFGCEKVCFLSFSELEVEWDRRMRDTPSGMRLDPVDPTRGYYVGASLQYGGGPLGGDFQYVRLSPEVRGYASILENDRLTFGIRLRAGSLVSLKDEVSPITSRFYAGGGTSMRGFGNRRLSPLFLVQPTSSKAKYADVVPIGGERLFEGSVEARYRLNADFHFALFLDTGFNNPAQEDERAFSPSYFAKYTQYAVGGGLRYITLVGPIRVDLAYRLPIGTPPPVTVLATAPPPPAGGCFGLGTHTAAPGENPEGNCSLHISIGEAF